MTNFLNKLKSLIVKFSHFFPTPLPVGIAEFNEWADSIIYTYGFPDNDSVRFTLAVMILHMDTTTAAKPKRYFYKALHKGAANQVVSQVINDLKAKQEAAKLAAAQPVEAPTPGADGAKVLSNG